MRVYKILLIICCTILFTSCYDNIELDERGLVITIGVDKSEQKDSKFKVSLLIPNVSTIINSSENANPQSPEKEESISKNKNLKIAYGNSVATAMNEIDYKSNQNLYYGHTKLCIINEEILKDSNLLKQTIDGLERNKEISRKVIMLASEQKTSDILSSSDEDNILGIFINDLYKNNKHNLANTFKQSLESVIQDLLSTGTTLIPKIIVENNEVKLEGVAVIKDYKFIKWLDSNEARSVLWINNDNFGGEISADFENLAIPLDIDNKKTKMTLNLVGDKVFCNVNINVKGTVGEYSLSDDVITNGDKYKILEAQYKRVIVDEVLNGIRLAQFNNVDLFKIGELARKKYYSIYESNILNNPNYLSNIVFNVSSDVKITSSGSIK